MIVKDQPSGEQLASDVDYPFNSVDSKHRKRPYPSIEILGASTAVKALLKTRREKKLLTKGIISFKEAIDEVGLARLKFICWLFIQVIVPGINPNRIAHTFVLHRKKDGCHVHFFIVHIDLLTKKALRPYYHPLGWRRVDRFCRAINDIFGFHNPIDPANRRTHVPFEFCAVPRKHVGRENEVDIQKDHLNRVLNQALQAGQLNGPGDVDNLLTALEWKFKRHKGNRISLRSHGIPTFTLQGRVFSKVWNGPIAPDHVQALSLKFRNDRLLRMIRSAAYLSKSYGYHMREIHPKTLPLDYTPKSAPLLQFIGGATAAFSWEHLVQTFARHLDHKPKAAHKIESKAVVAQVPAPAEVPSRPQVNGPLRGDAYSERRRVRRDLQLPSASLTKHETQQGPSPRNVSCSPPPSRPTILRPPLPGRIGAVSNLGENGDREESSSSEEFKI